MSKKINSLLKLFKAKCQIYSNRTNNNNIHKILKKALFQDNPKQWKIRLNKIKDYLTININNNKMISFQKIINNNNHNNFLINSLKHLISKIKLLDRIQF